MKRLKRLKRLKPLKRLKQERSDPVKQERSDPVRVLVAKVGLDGHDRGLKIVARTLRDAGIEVIYLGIHNTPSEIVSSAVQEDVDAIGLSMHSAAHMTLFGEVIKLLKENQASDIAVFGGGVVPREDIGKLKRMGVKEIFTPGAPLQDIVEFVKAIKPPAPRAGTRKSLSRFAGAKKQKGPKRPR
jgi:methylmalonyl-CoA mutase C-terminal domain/subunit